MESVYLTLIIICMALLVLTLPLLCITTMGGESKIYCYLFEHKDWVKWEKVIEKFDDIQYVRHDEYVSNIHLNSYHFILPVENRTCEIVYWEDEGGISVHDFEKDGDCLCDFDEYHSGLLRDKLSEKFGYW